MDYLSQHEKVTRPWGNFERFTLNEATTVKIITVSAGESLSLQTHEHRDEFWRILAGSGTVTLDEKEYPANAGDDFFSPRHTKHRVTGGPNGLSFLEIAFGTFDEDDITRLDDRYGRA